MLNKTIRDLLEKKFGKPIRYPKDCDALAALIKEETKHQVSSSTLKRVLGFYKETESPRLYTLDAISMYIGYDSWEHAREELINGIDSTLNPKELISLAIPGIQLRLAYHPGRVLILYCLAEGRFKVLESNSTNLKVGDELGIPSILINHPLICSCVIRNGVDLGKYIGARNGGVSSVQVVV